MIVNFTKPALKQLAGLPETIRKKAHKQFKILRNNPRHPSIRFKKMVSSENRYEGRIDYHYRFAGKMIEEEFYITAIGPHDEGLGKK